LNTESGISSMRLILKIIIKFCCNSYGIAENIQLCEHWSIIILNGIEQPFRYYWV